MTVDSEDKLDRNYRSQNDSTDRLRDQIASLSEKMAVASTKVEMLADTVKAGLANVDNSFREFNSRYATKADVDTVAKELEEVRKNLTKGVWIILGAVIIATLTLVFRAGLIK